MSLLDKLRALETEQANPKEEKEKKSTSNDCWHRTKLYDDDAYEAAWDICPQVLQLMQKENIPDDISPDRILYFDTETTGLSGGTGTVAFLVGLGYLTEDGFVLHQYVMRDYPEEKYLLEHVRDTAEKFDAVCTFNGKSFDIPLLRDRFIMNRLDFSPLEKPHIDLLHICRAVWKMRLKRCSLTSLEEKILGKVRDNDLPGSEAPQRYFSFLKTGQFDLLQDVIDHNGQDVASLCILLTKMCSMYSAPEQLSFGEDLFSMGRALERGNHITEAEKCYRLTIDSGALTGSARQQMAEIYRRQGKIDDAACLWRQMESVRECGVQPMISLAKYYEHHKRDVKMALKETENAIMTISEPGFECIDTEQENQLYRRYRRLSAKMEKINGGGLNKYTDGKEENYGI